MEKAGIVQQVAENAAQGLDTKMETQDLVTVLEALPYEI